MEPLLIVVLALGGLFVQYWLIRSAVFAALTEHHKDVERRRAHEERLAEIRQERGD